MEGLLPSLEKQWLHQQDIHLKVFQQKKIDCAAFLEIAISDLYPCVINCIKVILYNELFISCSNRHLR